MFGTGSGCWATVAPVAVLHVLGLLDGAEPSLVVTVMSPIWEKVAVLVELGLVEQRFAAVMEVINDGQPVTDVARRFGVSRQTVHRWLRRYGSGGVAGLVDGSPKPDTCPHQMSPLVEAMIIELRLNNPGWGPRTLLFRLEAAGVDPLPGRSSVYRCLVRHGLIEPAARRRKKADYKRWERSRAMELWQMDVVGGVMLSDGCVRVRFMLVSAAPVGARHFVDGFRFLGDTVSGRQATVVPVGARHLVDGLCSVSTTRVGSGVGRCWWSWGWWNSA